MIDFLKYELVGVNPEILGGNPLLEFETKVNTKTGEIGGYSHAFYKGLEFQIFEPTEAHPTGRVTVEGSLHKYWNSGGHNFNDFDVNDVDEVLKDLKKRFQIIPENCHIKQLEIGLNAIPPYSTKIILQYCLLHKTDLFKWVFTNDEGNYIQVQHGNYFVKIYDKRKHYVNKGFNVPNEIMRFEIKYKKEKLATIVKKTGVKLSTKLVKAGNRYVNQVYVTLQDVLNYGLYNFKDLLLQEWHNVLFYDFTTLDNTKYKDCYSNPHFWIKLKQENFKYHRKNLNKITILNPENLKKKIADLMAEKIDLLNTRITQIKPLNIPVIRVVYKLQDHAKINRVCAVSGLNIEMQRKGSFLLSHEGLKYYHRTDRKIYNEVKRKYLTELWQKENNKNQIKEIAHNIRNTWNNKKIKQRKLYPQHQVQLFSLEESFLQSSF